MGPGGSNYPSSFAMFLSCPPAREISSSGVVANMVFVYPTAG